MRNFNFRPLYLLAIGVLITMTSCVNLAKRFRTHETTWLSDSDVDKYVTVHTETYKISETLKTPNVPKDIFSLTPEGQAALINAITSKEATVEKIFQDMTLKLSAENTVSTKVKFFPTTINKSIVFSVDKLWESYGKNTEYKIFERFGDRISNLEISLQLSLGSNIQFNSWDKFVTDWATVDLGKVTSSQQWSATANINATASAKLNSSNKSTNSNINGTKSAISQTETSGSSSTGSELVNGTEISNSIGPSANLNFTDKYETALNLQLSRMKLSGTLSKDYIKLRQEGAFGIDLSGNTSVSVEYTFTGDYAVPIYILKIPKYYDSDGKIIACDKLLINKIMYIFPDVKDVSASIQYKYLYRHVLNSSAKHIPEARQNAQYFYGEVGHRKDAVPQNVILIKREDFVPVTYRIGDGKTYLSLNNEIINFETSVEAANFLEYFTNLGNCPSITPTINTYRIIKFQN